MVRIRLILGRKAQYVPEKEVTILSLKLRPSVVLTLYDCKTEIETFHTNLSLNDCAACQVDCRTKLS